MKTLTILILGIFTSNAFSQAERKHIRDGNGDYREGNYQQAELEYRKALEKDPSSYKADYNLGNALYKQKQYDAAAGRYSALAENEADRENLGRYYYNLGNTLYQGQKYKESIEAYKMALRNLPGDVDAKHNLLMAMRKMQEQQNQQQQKDKQGQNQDEKDQKDKQEQENKEDTAKQNPDRQEQEQKGDEQRQNDEQQDQLKDQQQKEGEISREDAERILQALENQEKQVMERIQERKEENSRQIPVEKNW